MKMKAIQISRVLRKNQTESEKMLWDKLRAHRYKGLKFLRQHPLVFEQEGSKKFFVADFFCFEKKIIIELDGKVHESQKDRDLLRDKICETLGYKTVRVKNKEILSNLDGILENIF